jgi:sugar phosphate isomerase/epimerase
MMTRRAFTAALGVAPLGAKAGFRAPVGTNLYSFRYLAEKDLEGTLSLIAELGFKDVEVGELYGRTAPQMRDLLGRNGLECSSFGASWESLGRNLEEVSAQAHALGASYVVCSTIPHSAKHLTLRDCQEAAASLNRWGENLGKRALSLCYHTHGTEFDPSPAGTVFDSLVRLTDPHVRFEMDIFWIVYGGQTPAALLQRYPKRFPLMHIKDIRKGLPLGGSPRDVEENDSVPLGTGIVDVSAALLAGQDTGVRHFYLEEEATDAVPQIRQSLRYLESLR